jgi:hypothetical protein
MMRRRGPGLIGVAARTAVFAGTATAVSGAVYHRQQQRYAQEAEQQQAMEAYQLAEQQQAMAQQQTSVTSEPDYAGELQRLAELKQRGIITESDFEAKKRQLLGI